MTTEAGKAPATKAGQELLADNRREGAPVPSDLLRKYILAIEAEAAAAARGDLTVERLAKALDVVAESPGVDGWATEWSAEWDDSEAFATAIITALAAHDPATPA